MGASNPIAPQSEPIEVAPGSPEAQILAEELELLAKTQKELAAHALGAAGREDFDQDLLSLRDQIADARTEDVAPLVAEMYRMQALGAQNGRGRDLPVDPKSPYFGHLKLATERRTRDVLIGSRGFVQPGSPIAIVDWRNAPISRIYYCYEEGDEYEEEFGNRVIEGQVLARRTVSVVDGELVRIHWADGALLRHPDGRWLCLGAEERPTLRGGAGSATRVPSVHSMPVKFRPKQLGVVGDGGLRDDKHLREITALIDRAQFDMITRPDSGTVILQGGAGSGKTTVALHRAAYLHFQDPKTFAPKNMLVVLKSEPLTEYISRVLPSLDVQGTTVITLDDWMQKTREKVLPSLKRRYIEDVPDAVAHLKKHPVILHLLERAVAEEAKSLGEALAARAGGAADAVTRAWTRLAGHALRPRIRQMMQWVEGPNAARAGLKSGHTAPLLGILRRAESEAKDIIGTWAQTLTDQGMIEAAFRDKATPVEAREIEELVRFVTLQDDESAPPDTEDGAGAIDGRNEHDESPRGKFDRHDDALLLKIAQLKWGGLPIAGGKRSVMYEHIVVDEAQDLSPTDVAVLRGALTRRASMTLAGDTAQKLIFDNSFEDWHTLLEDVGISGIKVDQLKVSYRSTAEIVSFARDVLGPLADDEAPVVPRSGAPVERFVFGSTGEATAMLGEALRSLVLRERKANVAVVARYRAQADLYYEGLRKSEVPATRRVYGKNFSFAPGVDVVEVSQIKGLEYDYVVLVEVNADSYPDQREARHLLHIGATRAVHQLWVMSTQHPSPILPAADTP